MLLKKLGNREMQQERAIKYLHLPFAGITLFRFNGFDLSLRPISLQHPGERNHWISMAQK
jgi:hypothetical protein